MNSRLLSAALVAAIAPALHAQATYSVPGSHPTIQAAISASVNGDTVIVAPGTYLENIDFGGKDITVLAPVGPGATTIDGGMTGITVLFSAGSSRAAVLDGFTITGGAQTAGGALGTGAGIRVDGASPTIRNCVVSGNTAAAYGGGIGVVGSSSAPLIDRCTIRDNQAIGLGYASGGGIAISAAGAVEIRDCTVSDNACATRGGGIYFAYSPGGTIDRCQITRNSSAGTTGSFDGGAGIFLALNSVVTVTNCRIWDNNSASNGGGVKFFNVTAAQFINNTITANAGGAIAGYATSATHGTNVVCDFHNCIIWQNLGGPEFVFTGTDSNGAMPDAQVTFSNVTTVYPGAGNISAPPMLLNVASGNLRLAPGSPCVNAGTGALPNLPTVDMDGQPRSIGTPDMGADELDPSSPLHYADTGTISVASPPASVIYTVVNGPSSGVFGVFFGVSGTYPGTMIFGQTVPLNIDFLTSIYTPVAALNAAGTGNVVLPFSGLTLTPSLVGITLSSVAMTVAGSGIDFTNPENVRFVP